MIYYTIKDDEGTIRPRAFLIKEEDIKFYQKDVDKFEKENCKLVKVEIKEIN